MFQLINNSMLTLNDYLAESKPSSPRWERDTGRKMYIVFDKDNNVYNEHPYENVWNSSSAYNAAVADVNKLKKEIDDNERHYHQFEAPLSELEKDYVASQEKMNRLHKQAKSMPEGSPEQTKIVDEYVKIANGLNNIKDYVRSSIIMRTHKDLKK